MIRRLEEIGIKLKERVWKKESKRKDDIIAVVGFDLPNAYAFERSYNFYYRRKCNIYVHCIIINKAYCAIWNECMTWVANHIHVYQTAAKLWFVSITLPTSQNFFYHTLSRSIFSC
jgi:hypothetical protein